MDRLTRPDIDTVQTAVRFMGEEVKIQDISDKLLHLILNGPTINSVNKDTLRHLVRQLYTELKRYEDLEMTPEAIEQQLTNFSSFLMEMTGGRMSKTNYTVQAMVSEANDYFEGVCDECADRQELAALKQELIDERHRHDRLQDFEVDEAQELARVKAEMEGLQNSYQQLQEINDWTYRTNMAMGKALEAAINDLQECSGCTTCKHKDISSMEEPCISCFRSNGREDKWEWRGAKEG